MKQVSVFEFVMVLAAMALIVSVAIYGIGTLLEPSIGTWPAALVGFAVGMPTAFYAGYTYGRMRLFNAD